MGEQVKLQVHHARFFELQPQTINCISHDKSSNRVAVSRSDASVEILGTKDNWHQEMVFPGSNDASVEAMIWAQGRLFAAGLGGNVVELDLAIQAYKTSVSSNSGPIWCLVTNAAEDRLAAGTEDGCVVLFDVTQELQFLKGFGKQEGRILSIAWYNREDENVIVTGGINNIRQWSIKSGQPISRMSLAKQFNKDTIVWCIAVTSDFTIISGDSRGIVTFWNGKESTQMKTFHCHKADVLTLCLSEDEQTAFSGGVDAALYQFSLCANGPTSERKRWVMQLLHTRHSHDIRALAYKDGCLVSGGVDTYLYLAELRGQRSVREVTLFHSGLVNIAEDRNLIQLQYPKYIEIWRFGTAAAPPLGARGILPLTQNPVKLVQLKAREDQLIQCSAMSRAGIVGFSDTKGVRLYRLDTSEQSSQPQVSLSRIKTFGLVGAARLMTFTPDNLWLVVSQVSGNLQVVSVDTGRVKQSLNIQSDSLIHVIATSPDNIHLATATVDHEVHLYNLQTGQHVCSCPTQTSQVSALAFSPHTATLVIAYCNQKLYEFDVEKKEYSTWSRENSERFGHDWLLPLRTISCISFTMDQPHQIAFHTDTALCVMDKTKSMDKPKEKSQSGRNQKMEAVNTCLKYRYLLYAGFLSNGMLVAVERSPSDIRQSLPPSFKQKKFGAS